jgi:hypothetical protein
MRENEHRFLIGGIVPIGESPLQSTPAEQDEVEFVLPSVPGRRVVRNPLPASEQTDAEILVGTFTREELVGLPDDIEFLQPKRPVRRDDDQAEENE